MGAPYTGQAVPPPGQDAPPPLAGTAPAPVLVVDADAPVAASFIPAPKANADFIAWIQKILNGAPAMTPGSSPGFTATTNSGAGTGTITPTAVSSSQAQKTNQPVYVAIKITTAGAAGGGAQAAWSNDGGATYGAPFAVPAGTHSDTTSGITVTFAGTFTQGDIYTLVPTCQPQLATKDSGGNVRHVIDHNGYPMGRRCEFREDWYGYGFAASGQAIGGSPPYMLLAGPSGTMVLGAGASGGSKWQVNGTASVGSIFVGGDVYLLGANVVDITSGTSNGNKTYLQCTAPIGTPLAKGVMVLEWEAYLSAIGANNVTASMGLFDGYASPLASTNRLYFTKTSAQTNWQLNVGGTAVDTGTPPVANTWQRFRVEFHGASTPLGTAVGNNVVLAFINEKLVAVLTAVTFAGTPSPMYGLEVTAGLGGGVSLVVSPILGSYSRSYSDIPSMPAL